MLSDEKGRISMRVDLRSAADTDIDAIVGLNAVVQRLHADLYPRDFKSSVDAAQARAFFAALLGSAGQAVGIAELNGALVGYIWFEVRARSETPFTFGRRLIYIHHLSVSPDVHRRGIASALLGLAQRRAVQEGIVDIALDAWSDNLSALRFFQASAFRAYNVLMRRRSTAPDERAR
jgi:ribosomal protein S18 acetylase RimI-like enzyme